MNGDPIDPELHTILASFDREIEGWLAGLDPESRFQQGHDAIEHLRTHTMKLIKAQRRAAIREMAAHQSGEEIAATFGVSRQLINTFING